MKTRFLKTLLLGLALVGITLALSGAGSHEVQAKRLWLYPCHEQPSAMFSNVTIIEKTPTSVTFRPSQESVISVCGTVIEHHGNYTIEN